MRIRRRELILIDLVANWRGDGMKVVCSHLIAFTGSW
jgi:hypothetical protein